MKKWKILLLLCYLCVLGVGLGSYFYGLAKNDNDDFPLFHRLVCCAIFFAFTLLQWIAFKRTQKKIPDLEKKASKRAYRFLQGCSVLKVIAAAGFDVYFVGGISFILLLFSPFTLGNASAASSFGMTFLFLFITYLPWILFVCLAWLIESILLNRSFNVKKKGSLGL